MANEKMKVFTFANLSLYDELLKGRMDVADAKALKTVAISNNTLKFYKVEEPVGETQPAFEITLPEADVSGLLAKLTGATAGHVVTAKADGTVEDSGVALTDLAKKTEVNTVKTDIEAKIGTVTEGKTVVEMIQDAKTAATYDDAEVKADIVAIEADYLKEADKTALTQAIATAKQEAIAAIMGEAGIDEKYDTLKEVADWILADTTNSAALVAKVDGIYNDYLKGADKTELEGKISAVSTLVGTIPESATSTTVVAYVNEVVTALKIGDYAKAADLTALVTRVAAVEEICEGLGTLATKSEVTEADIEATLLAKINKAHEHTNKDVLDDITSTLVAQWRDAYAKAHEHTNATELAKIAAGDKAKWDAMEQNAKDYADGLNTAMDSRVDALESKIGDGYEAITETEIRGLFE